MMYNFKKKKKKINLKLEQPLRSAPCVLRSLPAGANGILGSNSDRSALILLLSDAARHCVRAGRLSKLPPRERGRLLNGSPWRRKIRDRHTRRIFWWYNHFIHWRQNKNSAGFQGFSWWEKWICLGLEVRRKLRRNLDCVVASLRVTVLDICLASTARVGGGGVVHVGTCNLTNHQLQEAITVVLLVKLVVDHSAVVEPQQQANPWHWSAPLLWQLW